MTKSFNLLKKRKEVINDLINSWENFTREKDSGDLQKEIISDLKALRETLDKQDKEAVKELEEKIVTCKHEKLIEGCLSCWDKINIDKIFGDKLT